MNSEWGLKVSLTNQCNYQCIYCNDSRKNKKSCVLDSNKIQDILNSAQKKGLKKIHWTGGEPTLVNLSEYFRMASELGFEEQSITSNGFLLDKYIDDMLKNGLSRMNISLDSLSKDNYKKITGVDGLDKVTKLIQDYATKVEIIKVNVAIMKSNISEVGDLLNFCINTASNVILKLHELSISDHMDTYNKEHVPFSDIVEEVKKYGTLLESEKIKGSNPSIKYYSLVKNDNKTQLIGLAAAPTSWTCGGPDCKKIRIYSHGETCEGYNFFDCNNCIDTDVFEKVISGRSTSVVNK